MAAAATTSASVFLLSLRNNIARVGNALLPSCLQRQTATHRVGHEGKKSTSEETHIAKTQTQVMDEKLCSGDHKSQSEDNASGVENVGFSLDDEGSIECLTDDALLNIFSFLSMVDRGKVARVCKRWNTIMKDSRLWTYVNFWQTNHSPAIKNNPWTNETLTLRLLQTYANSGLRIIHLKVIGADILLFLRQHCPNVEIFSFFPPTCPPRLALNSKCRPVPYFTKDVNNDMKDSLQIPQSAIKVQLTFMGVEAPPGRSFVDIECGSFTHALLYRLSRCRHLRHLSLAHCNGLTTEGVAKLTESLPDLLELWLMDFKHQPSGESDTLRDVLQCIARNLTNLSSFHFITTQLDEDFDEFFQTISKHGKLKQLWLGRGSYCFSEESFAELCRNLPGLEELVLESCNCITDTVIECIGQNLKKLKLLNLLGSGTYTSESVHRLQNHPSLQFTNVPGLQLSR